MNTKDQASNYTNMASTDGQSPAAAPLQDEIDPDIGLPYSVIDALLAPAIAELDAGLGMTTEQLRAELRHERVQCKTAGR